MAEQSIPEDWEEVGSGSEGCGSGSEVWGSGSTAFVPPAPETPGGVEGGVAADAVDVIELDGVGVESDEAGLELVSSP